MEIKRTLSEALDHSIEPVDEKIFIVETNAKGDMSGGREEIKIEVEAVKKVQEGNSNIIVYEILVNDKSSLLTLLRRGQKEKHKGRKMSLGGGTKVK